LKAGKRLVFWVVNILVISTIVWSIPVDAKFASTDIRDQIKQDFESYIPSLEKDKKNFGMDEDDQADQVKLGEGYPYYKVAVSFLKQSAVAEEVYSEDILEMAGYNFPIYLKGQSVGVVHGVLEEGKWIVDVISSDFSFERTWRAGRENFDTTQPVKLIDDPRLGIYAMSGVKDGMEQVVPVQTDPVEKLAQSSEKNLMSLQHFAEQAYERHQEIISDDQDGTGGGAGGIEASASQESAVEPFMWAAILLVLMITGIIVYRKIYSHNSNK